MTFKCDLTGRVAMSGNSVSNSCRKVRRKQYPNIHKCRFYSNTLNRVVVFRVSVRALRTVDKFLDFDNFMRSYSGDGMSERARRIKRDIAKRLASKNIISGEDTPVLEA